MVFTLFAACSREDDDDDRDKDDKKETTTEEAPAKDEDDDPTISDDNEDENKDRDDEDENPDDKDDSKNDKLNISISEKTLYNKNNVKITVTEIEGNWGDYSIKLEIKNSNSDTICVYGNSIIINDSLTFDGSFYETVKAGKTVNTEVYLWDTDLEFADLDVNDIGKIVFKDVVIEEDETFDEIDTFDMEITTSLKKYEAIKPSGDTLYEDDILTINYVSSEIDDDYMEVILCITNNYDDAIDIEMEDVYIEDYQYAAWLFDNIYEGTCKYVTIYIWEDEIEMDLKDIDTLVIEMTATAMNDWEDLTTTGEISFDL